MNPFKQISGRGAGLSVTGISWGRAKPELGSYDQMQPPRAASGSRGELLETGEFLP